MKIFNWIIIGILVNIALFALLFIKIFPDPYYHLEDVNFYTWIYREIDELFHGEKADARY